MRVKAQLVKGSSGELLIKVKLADEFNGGNDPDTGENISRKDVLAQIASRLKGEKLQSVKIKEAKVRGITLELYVDAPDGSEQSMYAAEDAVQEILARLGDEWEPFELAIYGHAGRKPKTTVEVLSSVVVADVGSDLLKAVERAAKIVTSRQGITYSVKDDGKDGEFSVVSVTFKEEGSKYPSTMRVHLYPTLKFYASEGETPSGKKTSLQALLIEPLGSGTPKRVYQNYDVKNWSKEIKALMLKHGFDYTTY